MRKSHRLQLDRYMRIQQFGRAQQAYFPEGSRGQILFAQIDEIVEKLEQLARERQSETYAVSGHVEDKALIQDKLWKLLRAISRSAATLPAEKRAIAKKFSVSSRRPAERDLLTTAQQFLNDGRLLAGRLGPDDMPANFLTRLEQLTNALTETRSGKIDARTSSREAMEEIQSEITRGNALIRQLDSVIRNKFEDNHVLLSSWQAASRTDRLATRTATGAEEKNTNSESVEALGQ